MQEHNTGATRTLKMADRDILRVVYDSLGHFATSLDESSRSQMLKWGNQVWDWSQYMQMRMVLMCN